MIRPVSAPISQGFGANPTRHLPADSWLIQTFGNYQPDGHTGQDYACDIGSPVRAVTSGTVLHIGWMGGTYADNPWWVQPGFAGYCAVIDHGSFVGIYGHCKPDSARVSKGARVDEGQVFILSGNSGGSTGPHLHFEILPDQWVLNSEFYGRIDPEPLFAGTITPQSAPEPTKEWYEMPIPKADLDNISKAVWQLAGVEGEAGQKQTMWRTIVDLAKESRQNTATIAGLTRVLASGSGLTEDQITEAVKAAFVDLVKD